MAGAVHGAARRAHMPASSEIGSDLRYIDEAAGSHAHLILQHACFIHEYGAFHALDTAKLAYNALQILGRGSIKIHGFPVNDADHAFSVHEKDAFQQCAAEYLRLQIGFS